MRIGILCHRSGLARWQAEAIAKISGTNRIFLLTCDPPEAHRRSKAHLAYYALNLAAIRNSMTRSVPLSALQAEIAGEVHFSAAFDRSWAVLPDEVIDWMLEQRLDAVVKFGLGLMRVPDTKRLPVPILSYHHGDPRRYRGRPAGFYEMQHGEPFMGQVVQVISNKLDQGEVLAFAESRVIPHSYRKTLIGAYRLSPYLLPRALEALAAGQRLAMDPAGTNYRLPTNGKVARFMAGRMRRFAGRLGYGAFVEKRWEVASVAIGAPCDPVSAVREAETKRQQWNVLPRRLANHSFYADPFFHSGPDDVLVEAMSATTGKGELVRVRAREQHKIGGFSGHISYPATIEEAGELFLVPEISDWSRPAIYRLDGLNAQRVAELDGDMGALLDPTLARVGDRLFLFANRVEDGHSVLHLWSAPSLFGRFELHPASPIRVSDRGSRMAGELLHLNGALFRLGQEFRNSYGDGILAFEILEMDESRYREAPAGEAAFSSVRGPHTINLRGNTLLFDYYEEKRTPLAGMRRLLGRV